MRFINDKPVKEPTCPYIDGGGVLCGDATANPDNCKKCGWYPAVHEKRLAKVRKGGARK